MYLFHFVESGSSRSHKPLESELSQSHLNFFESSQSQCHVLVESQSSHKNCRVISSHWFASSSQCRVKRNFTFFLRHFFAMKWHPTCHKMVPDKLENGAQHAMKLNYDKVSMYCALLAHQ